MYNISSKYIRKWENQQPTGIFENTVRLVQWEIIKLHIKS